MHYSVVLVTVTDPGWVEGYIPAVQKLVEKHGGRYLARAQEIKRVEGQGANPNAVVVIQWPSEAAANAFYQDPAYAPYLKARLAGSTGDFFNVPRHGVTSFARVQRKNLTAALGFAQLEPRAPSCGCSTAGSTPGAASGRWRRACTASATTSR